MHQVAGPNHIDHNLDLILCPVNILFTGSILKNEKERRKEERKKVRGEGKERERK